MLHIIEKEIVESVKKQGLLTASKLVEFDPITAERKLLKYLKQIYDRRAYEKALRLLYTTTNEKDLTVTQRATAALLSIRGDCLQTCGSDWFYGIHEGWGIPYWFKDPVKVIIDDTTLKTDGLLVDATYLGYTAIDEAVIETNRLRGDPLYKGIPHPMIKVKGGQIPPKYLVIEGA